MTKNEAIGVIVLSAGKGSRMNSGIPKQYMTIHGYPVLYYSLKLFDEYDRVSDIVIAASKEDIDMVQTDIVEKYGIKKVSAVIPGGTERYDSVYNALQRTGDVAYVMIHDGARPCISIKMLDRLADTVIGDKACVPAVPSKDTVRIADKNGYVIMTPNREDVWNMQTPQTFEKNGILNAYNSYYQDGHKIHVTDDAMLWEMYDKRKIKLVMGEYTNIKLTTPEDVASVSGYLQHF